MPDILVVTPTLGLRPQVARTILSVRNISGPRSYHCIVGPIAQTQWIKDLFPHVHLLDDAGCDGIYDALNRALFTYAHKYELFSYINDDDFWLPGYQQLIRIMDASRQISLVYGRTMILGPGSTFQKIAAHFPFPRIFIPLIRHSIPIFTQQAVLCRTEALLSLHGFDTKYRLCADSDLFARFFTNHYLAVSTNSICAAYTFGNDRLSSDTRLLLADKARFKRVFPPRWSLLEILYITCFRLYNLPEYLGRVVTPLRMNAKQMLSQCLDSFISSN